MTELACYKHPDRPTLLRCNQCERPICISCAVRTPTGYRCKECVSGQQKKFDTALWSDYVIVFFTGAVLSGLASLLILAISSFIWFIVIILAPITGVTIGNLARRLVKGRHSRWLNLIFGASMIVGALPMLLALGLGGALSMIALGQGGGASPASLLAFTPLLWQVVYLVIATPAAYSQFSGVFLRK